MRERSANSADLRAGFLNRGIMPVIIFVLLSMAVFSLSRLGLSIWKSGDVSGNLFEIFVQGLRSDFSICCTMYAPALLLMLVLNAARRLGVTCKWILCVYLASVLTVHVVIELATPPFILEYGVRPNHLFVDYLIYPKEVISTLISGHLLATVFSILAGIVCFALSLKLSLRLFRGYTILGTLRSLIMLVLVAAICALGIRSTLGHRPLNPSMLSFCNDPMANDLPVNSSFKVFYAIRHYGENDLNEGQLFAYDTDENVIAAARELSARTEPQISDPKCPLNQVITPAKRHKKPMNVVVVLEESMGADFVESLGGLPLTPELEKLSREGWWFSRMFAAGHRSVRGIEAVTAGYPPSPLASQVKLDHDAPMATLMQIFKGLGYKTSFIYGGESHFDNMRTYFLYNGTDEVIEQKDYQDPSFVASWGVSDEDLFKKADESFSTWHEQGQPFCAVVFSSSFHDPFDIPDGKVDIGDLKTDEPLRLNAVKYADYALGKFFEQAKKRDYYSDTIFLVIADHESRVRAESTFPFGKFSIPALILGPGIAPRNDGRVVNQIDMLPTLLSLAGVEGEFPLVGQDLNRADVKERAMMVYNELFGYLQGDDFEVLAPDHKATAYKVGNKNLLEETDVDETLVDFGKALENLGLATYQNRWNDYSCVKGLGLAKARSGAATDTSTTE